MKSLFSYLLTPFNATGKAFLFSILLYLFSLIFNTSFRIMGFDLSSEIKSAINQDFVVLALLVNLKIILLYYLFYSFIELNIDLFIKSLGKKYKTLLKLQNILVYFSFIFITLAGLIHSIVKYPQVYGEFFYLRHTFLLPLLYFFTDHINPAWIDVLFLTIISAFSGFILLNFLYSPGLKSLASIAFFLLILFLHIESLLILMPIVFFLYQVCRRNDIGLSRFLMLPLLVLLLVIFAPYYYFEKIFEYHGERKYTDFNLIVISADSLRADRIGAKRGEESITPNIDSFIQDSFVFADHHVTIPRTFPSWADLLTGEYSMTHKIRDMFPAPEEKKNLGTENFLTIGHYLQKKKYDTAVFSNFAGDIFKRADFGFQDIIAPDFNAKVLVVQKSLESQIFVLPIITGSYLKGGRYFEETEGLSTLGDGARLLPDVFSYMKKRKKKPFFVTAFFSVTHFPYSPPYPNYKKFTDPNYYGKYKYFKFVDPTASDKPDEKDIEQIRAVFDASVYSFDRSFGKLVQFLKKEGLYENSVIVITGDHGETLYEGIYGHGHGEHLRGPNITSVPLIIKFPKDFYRDRGLFKFNGVTSSIDLMPTLMEFFQVDANKKFPGRSLIQVLGKENWEDDRSVYAETGIWFSDIGDHFFQSQRIMYPNILKLHRIVPEENYQIMITDPFYRDTIAFAKHRTLISSKYKFIYIPTRDGVQFELYDRKTDPEDTKNIYDQNAYTGEAMKQELYRLAQDRENATIISDYIVPPPVSEE